MEFNDAFWSALKRKDTVMMAEYIFEQLGYTKAAEECRKTSRLTTAAAERIKQAVLDADEGVEGEEVIPVEGEEEVETTEEVDPEEHLDYQDAINEEAEANAECVELEKKVKKAIKKGNVEKAKKALKKLKKAGCDKETIAAFKDQIEALEA
jgi:hypothetical protein